MEEGKERKKKKTFMMQPMMINVVVGLIPCALASIYFFGLRSLVMLAVVLVFGIASEAIFTLPQGKPITSAVLVTCFIYTLSLPPTTPFWIAVLGVVFGVVFGKMVFGGFGYNPFNPAMVGRCFVYLAFPIALTNRWVDPFSGGPAGFLRWSPLPLRMPSRRPHRWKFLETAVMCLWRSCFWEIFPDRSGKRRHG